MGQVLGDIAAILIGLSAVAVIVGVVFIKRGDRVWHPRAMLVATALAALFLVFYLLKWGLFGTTRYAGPEEWRTAYFALLISHIVLASLHGPMVLWLLYNAFKKRFAIHKAWARWVVPVWLYIAATGWVIDIILRVHGEPAEGIRF
jgi:putative membrane protein